MIARDHRLVHNESSSGWHTRVFPRRVMGRRAFCSDLHFFDEYQTGSYGAGFGQAGSPGDAMQLPSRRRRLPSGEAS